MLDFTTLLLLLCAGTLAAYWWQSGVYKGRARELAGAHCSELGLQLLDQSMVIVGLWPVRDAQGRIVFRRSYLFEFASVGDRRYQGKLQLEGMALKSIDLEPYKLPDSDAQ